MRRESLSPATRRRIRLGRTADLTCAQEGRDSEGPHQDDKDERQNQVRKTIRVVVAADRRRYGSKRKYKKAEANHLVPQRVQGLDDLRKDVLCKFPGRPAHATFSVADRCY